MSSYVPPTTTSTQQQIEQKQQQSHDQMMAEASNSNNNSDGMGYFGGAIMLSNSSGVNNGFVAPPTNAAVTPWSAYVGMAIQDVLGRNDIDADEEERQRQEAQSHRHDGGDAADEELDLDEISLVQNIYYVKQKYAWLTISLSVLQFVLLCFMILFCGGLARPIQINPMLGPYPDTLDSFGAKNATKIINSFQYFRLFTPILLHTGLIHFVLNMSVQADLSSYIEKEWGSRSWLLIFTTCGVGSILLSVNTGVDNISVASTGALIGLFTAKLTEILFRLYVVEAGQTEYQKQQQRISTEVRQEQLGAVCVSIFVLFLLIFVPYIDVGVIFGGMITGMLVGFAYFTRKVSNTSLSCMTVSNLKLRTYLMYGSTVGLALYFSILTINMLFFLQPSQYLSDPCGYYQSIYPDYTCACSSS